MAEIWIHVGTHKTGSTAIQHALRENRRWLRRNGWAYLLPVPVLRTLMMAQDVNPVVVQEARAWLDSVGRWHGRRHRLLISSEGFAGNPYDGYRNAAVVAESLRQITDGHTVGIIIYLRRQDEFLESMYTQRIQEGGSLSFAEFLEECGDVPDWSALLRAYADRFGQERIVVRRYHRAFLPKPDSLLLDFSRALHLPALSMERVPTSRNAGYSREALEFARMVNSRLSESEQRALRKILQETCAKQVFSSFSLFGRNERIEMLIRCRQGNVEVAQWYFPGEDGRLFPAPSESHCVEASFPGLTMEVMAEILARILLHGQQGDMRAKGRGKRHGFGLGCFLAQYPRCRETLLRMAECMGWR